MLFMRYGEGVDASSTSRSDALLTRALETAGFSVDFRDYQLCESADPFDLANVPRLRQGSGAVVGLSCMANLLPFTLLAAEALKARRPI